MKKLRIFLERLNLPKNAYLYIMNPYEKNISTKKLKEN
jgi:hypothetical protein